MKLLTIEVTDSTNALAQRLAPSEAGDFAVLARRQTAGRGRGEHTFCSEPGGMYLTVRLCSPPPPERLCLVTPYAAVAVCEAVEAACGARPLIKWVNDLYLDKRKICGILCACSSQGLLIGVGLNVGQKSFPPPLCDTAISLAQAGFSVDADALAGAIADRLAGLAAPGALSAALPRYRQLSCVLGKRVTVLSEPPREATAVAVDDDGALVVREADGRLSRLTAGEISVKVL